MISPSRRPSDRLARGLLGAALLCIRPSAPATAAAAHYELILLGNLGGITSGAYGVNEHGQVAGAAELASGYIHAFLWTDGVMRDLGTLGGSSSWANAVNSAGQVVGKAQTAGGEWRAFLWENGAMTDLGTLGGPESEAFDVNDTGQVAGWADVSTEDLHAFRWENGAMTDLGVLFDCCSQAFAINDAGQVGGWAPTATGWFQGFVWDDGSMEELPTLGGLESWANGMNDAGSLVGAADTADGDTHAAMWTGEQWLDLGTLGGLMSEAYAVNELDQVVGWSAIDESNEVWRAFLWESGAMIDLNTLVEAPEAGELVLASDINDGGQIVGTCEGGAFLLTPVPTIQSFALGAGGRLALAWSHMGDGWAYIVESRSALAEGDWAPVEPAGQWPISGTGWETAAPAGARQLFFRVSALYQRP